jgi:hypothetical protein
MRMQCSLARDYLWISSEDVHMTGESTEPDEEWPARGTGGRSEGSGGHLCCDRPRGTMMEQGDRSP